MITKNKLVTLEILKMVNDQIIDSSIKGEVSGVIASFKDCAIINAANQQLSQLTGKKQNYKW